MNFVCLQYLRQTIVMLYRANCAAAPVNANSHAVIGISLAHEEAHGSLLQSPP
jgi:hypothetical protein